MIRAGVVGAGLGAIYAMGATLVSPFCTICLTPLLGIGSGYLANWFNKPLSAEASLRHGLVAGALTGFGAMLGQMLGAFVHAVLFANWPQFNIFLRDIGLADFIIDDAAAYFQTTMAVYSFCGLFNLAFIVGLGAVGGLIWFQRDRSSVLSATMS